MKNPVFICDMQDHAPILEEKRRLVEIGENFRKGMHFFRDQMEKLADASDKKRSKSWDNITDYLMANNLMPKNYDENKHMLSFVNDNEQLFMTEKDEDGIEINLGDILKRILK